MGVLSLVTLAGCGSTTSDDATIPTNDPATQSVAPTYTSSTSGVSPSPTSSAWVLMRNKQSGVRFHGQVRVAAKHLLKPVESWNYTVTDPAAKQLSGTISIVRGGPTDINTVLSTLVGVARNSGMSDAQGSDVHKTTVDGVPAQAGRINFSVSGGLATTMALTAVPSGQFAVYAQAVGTGSKSSLASLQPKVDQLMAKLLAGIRLPRKR